MKFCHKCKLAIDIKTERYIRVEDIENKKTLSKVFMHKNCWHDLMTSKGQAKELVDMTKKLIKDVKNKTGMECTPLIEV